MTCYDGETMSDVQTPPRAQAREDTRDARVDYVVRLIAAGKLLERHDLRLARRWDVEPSHARAIISEARRLWRRVQDPEELLDLAHQLAARYDRLYEMAVRAGDIKSAIAANRERARVAGLDKRTLVLEGDGDTWAASAAKGPRGH